MSFRLSDLAWEEAPIVLAPTLSCRWRLVRFEKREVVVRGEGRHKLEAACARRGIPLVGAHDAAADAEATGRLLYHVFSEVAQIVDQSLGTVLARQQRTEADQWANFNKWRSEQHEAEAAKAKVVEGVKKKPEPKRAR
jgi:DNA polymerase III epsilon subunit-like protein